MPLYANMLCKKPHTHTNKGNGNNQKYFKLFSVTIIGGNRIGVTYIIRSKVNGQWWDSSIVTTVAEKQNSW